MATVQPGSFLTLHYRLAGPAGDVINTFDGKPATLSLGTGELSPAIEQRLLGRLAILAAGAGTAGGQKDEVALQRIVDLCRLSEIGARAGLLWNRTVSRTVACPNS